MSNKKECLICHIEKEITEFHKACDRADGYRGDCKSCRKNKTKRDYSIKKCSCCNIIFLNNLEFFNKDTKNRTRGVCKKCGAKYSKFHHIKKKYNLSLDDYNNMILNQNSKCGICNKETKELVIDHNHTTRVVRELLCNNCNTGLGMFYENIDILKSVIKYITKYNQNTN